MIPWVQMETSNARLQRFYRWNAPIYDLTRWTILRRRRLAVSALELQAGETVLELGCGTGLNFALLRRQVGPGGTIIGVDLSEAMLKRARRRGGNEVNLICADAGRLELNCEVDAVLAAYSLSMVPDWRASLKRTCALLRPGGRIVVLDFGAVGPCSGRLRRLFDRYLALNHVETGRDFGGQFRSLLGVVEELLPAGAYATLVRGRRLRSFS